MFSDRDRNTLHPAADNNQTVWRFLSISVERVSSDNRRIIDIKRTKTIIGTADEKLVLLNAINGSGKSGKDSRRIPATASDIQHFVGRIRQSHLKQSRENHRLHQNTTIIQVQILINIGDAPEMIGDEQLPRNSFESVNDRRIGDFVRPDLTLNHVVASSGEVRHIQTMLQLVERQVKNLRLDGYTLRNY